MLISEHCLPAMYFWGFVLFVWVIFFVFLKMLFEAFPYVF